VKNPTHPQSHLFAIHTPAPGAALALAILLALAVVTAPSSEAETFDAPGAGTGPLQGTIGVSINAVGVIAGIYFDAGSMAHGFERAANGAITNFDAPGAGKGSGQGTFPTSINRAGAIAGIYTVAGNVGHGFVRAANGTITDFDVPGAGTDKYQGTFPLSINSAGAIVGVYKEAGWVQHGFVRAATGTITTFDAPDAGTGHFQGTNPIGISPGGTITGSYRDANRFYHGFVRAADDTITEFDAPCAISETPPGVTPISINRSGTIAGACLDTSGVNHGFVRAANGTIITFSVPGAGTIPHGGLYGTAGTGGFSINTAGVIAGTYTDANFVAHGFVRAANGTVTAFNAPGAGNNALLAKLIGMATSFPSQGTGAFSINAVGKIAGTYFDASTVLHGFVINATIITLTSSPNPSTYRQAVTFTAKVTSSVGAPPDGETIAFMNGNTTLGTGTLSGGSASFTTSTLKVGTSLVTAVYAGGSNFVGSTSRTVRQVVK
jgi:hypothetical protein